MITATKSSRANDYVGLSTDQKPAGAPNASIFFEMDTGDSYYYNGATGTWNKQSGSGGGGGGGGGGDDNPIKNVSFKMTKNPDITSNSILDITFEIAPYSREFNDGQYIYYPNVDDEGFSAHGNTYINYRTTKYCDWVDTLIPITAGDNGYTYLYVFGGDGVDFSNYSLKITGCAFDCSDVQDVEAEIVARKASPPAEPELISFASASADLAAYGDFEVQLVATT